MCYTGNARPVFLISPHLLSPEREAEYLSKLADTLVFFLWPKSYGKCAPVRHLLKVNDLQFKSDSVSLIGSGMIVTNFHYDI